MTAQKFSTKLIWRTVSLLVCLSMVLVACQGAETEAPTEAVEPTEAQAEEPTEDMEPTEAEKEEQTEDVEPTEAEMEEPTVLNVASIHGSVEDAWSKTWFEAWDRVAADSPHGLTINYDNFTENVWSDDALRVLREYAETGKYQIIWAHSTYSDQVKQLKDEYPDILWAVSGSGNEGLGDNVYWIYEHGHQGAYLLGILAGNMTESNTLGFVGGFPADDVNDALNGLIDGAKSVNPDVETKYTFIESWYDPVKAKEAALAQISAGADFVYCERLGCHEAAAEEGVYAFGHFEDQNYLAPNAVVSSVVIYWDPAIRYLVDEWWNHATTGEAYDAPTDPVWWGMAEGGVDIAPYHDLADEIPQDVKDAVAAAKEDILSGELEVPLKTDLP